MNKFDYAKGLVYFLFFFLVASPLLLAFSFFNPLYYIFYRLYCYCAFIPFYLLSRYYSDYLIF